MFYEIAVLFYVMSIIDIISLLFCFFCKNEHLIKSNIGFIQQVTYYKTTIKISHNFTSNSKSSSGLVLT